VREREEGVGRIKPASKVVKIVFTNDNDPAHDALGYRDVF
jgi:hypothetical protein